MKMARKGLIKYLAYLCLVGVIALGLMTIIGTGGGGDGGSSTAPVDLDQIGGTIYNTAYTVGDLLQFAFDPVNLDYGYNVIEGINEGDSGSGTLSLMAGYTQYVYEDEDNNPVLIVPENVFIGIPGDDDRGLFVGVPSLTTNYDVDDIAGVYNFVEFGGTGGDIDNYEVDYGTMEIIAGATAGSGIWRTFYQGNLTINPNGFTDSGTWEDQGNGIIYAQDEEGNKIANMMIHPSYAGDSDQKVLICDIWDTINNYRGIMLGVGQQAITEGSVDGTHSLLLSDDSDIFTIEVSGTTVTDPDGDINIVYNDALGTAWDGFITAQYPPGSDEANLLLALPGGIIFGVGVDSESGWMFAGVRE